MSSLSQNNVAAYAVILAVPVAIDDSNFRVGPKRRVQFSKQGHGIGNFVIRLQKQNRIDGIFRKKRIVCLPKDRLYVAQLLFLRPVVDVADRLRIDVDRVHRAGFAHSPRRPNREPTRPGSNVSNRLSRRDTQNIHHPIDLQTFITSRRFEDREIAGVWFACLAMLAGRAC